jgi:hypothetical protein
MPSEVEDDQIPGLVVEVLDVEPGPILPAGICCWPVRWRTLLL